YSPVTGGNAVGGGYGSGALIGYITSSGAVVSYDYDLNKNTSPNTAQIKYTNDSTGLTLTFQPTQSTTSTNYALPIALDNNPFIDFARNTGIAPSQNSIIGVIQFGGTKSTTPATLSVQYGSISCAVNNSTTGALQGILQLIVPDTSGALNRGLKIGPNGVYT